jgi:hypothetical protein
MQQFEERVAFLQWHWPNYRFANSLMRRIFLPDKEAPTRCSFANCNAPLDRRMPNARGVCIEVGASHINALVECTSLCLRAAIPFTCSDQQKHPDADWPFIAAETCTFTIPSFSSIKSAYDIFAIVDHMPLLTVLQVLERVNSTVMQLADMRSSSHQGTSTNRTRTDTQSRAHENFRGVYGRAQHKGNGARRSTL